MHVKAHQKKALYNTNDNDFTLKGKMGRELRSLTVGVPGRRKDWHCNQDSMIWLQILAYDVNSDDEVMNMQHGR